MGFKGRAQGTREVVLERLHFPIDGDTAGVRLTRLGLVDADEFAGEVLDRIALALLQTPAPECLERRAVGRAFADFERDDFGVEDIGHDLPPQL